MAFAPDPWHDITYPFTPAEATRLARWRATFEALEIVEETDDKQMRTDAKRLAYVRWLVTTRRLTEYP